MTTTDSRSLSELETALLYHLQEFSINAMARDIWPGASETGQFIVIRNDDGKATLGIWQSRESDVELFRLTPTAGCPDGFADDYICSYELSNPDFPDNLIRQIALLVNQ